MPVAPVMSCTGRPSGGQRHAAPAGRPAGRGFSAIELAVVVAILAILSMAAAPAFRESVVRYQLNSVTEDLRTSFAMARAEAARRPEAVWLERRGACTGGDDDWDCGWQLVFDANADNLAQLAEVVRFSIPPAGLSIIHASGDGVLGSRRVVFNRWGLPQPAGRRFVLGHANYPALTRTLCVNGTGGVRVLSGDVTCP